MWNIPHQHPFNQIKVQSKIKLIAVAAALICHNWTQIQNSHSD